MDTTITAGRGGAKQKNWHSILHNIYHCQEKCSLLRNSSVSGGPGGEEEREGIVMDIDGEAVEAPFQARCALRENSLDIEKWLTHDRPLVWPG